LPFGIPAFACCVILFPLRNSALLTVGVPGSNAWTSTGLPRSAGMRRDRGGPLLYPGAAVSSRPAGLNRSAPAAFQRPALHPRCNHPPAREAVTRHQRRFTRLARPIFPLPVPPGRNGKPSAFPPGFKPRRYQRRMPGWEQVFTDTDPELHLRHQPNLQTCSPLTTCDGVSHSPIHPGDLQARLSPTGRGAAGPMGEVQRWQG
jgi:hypothetical protein